MKIPKKVVALSKLPENFRLIYKDLSYEQVKEWLQPWVYEKVEKSTEADSFKLLDDENFTYLFWQKEPTLVVLHETNWRDKAGDIHDQGEHLVGWAYVAADLISITRVACGVDKKYVPLCVWFLSFYTPYDGPPVKPGHRCRGNNYVNCLKFIQINGVPKKFPEYKDFNCDDQPPSAENDRIKIESVVKIDTLERALEELRKRPIGATIIQFSNLFSAGKEIYRGPRNKIDKFEGYNAVIIVGVEEKDKEMVAIIKMSNGKDLGDEGYVYVSLSTMYMVVAAKDPEDPKNPHNDAHMSPQHLLFDFHYVEIEKVR